MGLKKVELKKKLKKFWFQFIIFVFGMSDVSKMRKIFEYELKILSSSSSETSSVIIHDSLSFVVVISSNLIFLHQLRLVDEQKKMFLNIILKSRDVLEPITRWKSRHLAYETDIGCWNCLSSMSFTCTSVNLEFAQHFIFAHSWWQYSINSHLLES